MFTVSLIECDNVLLNVQWNTQLLAIILHLDKVNAFSPYLSRNLAFKNAREYAEVDHSLCSYSQKNSGRPFDPLSHFRHMLNALKPRLNFYTHLRVGICNSNPWRSRHGDTQLLIHAKNWNLFGLAASFQA